jgi:hypothetical protein
MSLRAALVCLIIGSALVACSTLSRRLRVDENEQPNGVPRIEVDRVRYDGRDLVGRVQVTAIDGGVRIDRRFIENSSVTVRNAYDCDTGSPVEFLIVDSFPPPPDAEDLVLVTPGRWYGAEVTFSLFDERLNGRPGPNCVRADLDLTVYRGTEGRAERFRFGVTARRTPPAGGGDAGSTLDAGVP